MWCEALKEVKCASVHRSVLLCFTILFFLLPSVGTGLGHSHPGRPLVCSCLWRACQHVFLSPSFQPSPALRRIQKPPWHHAGSVSTNTDTSTHISPSKCSPAHDAEGENRLKSECVWREEENEWKIPRLIPSSAFFLSIKYAFQQEMEQIMDSSDDTNLATF